MRTKAAWIWWQFKKNEAGMPYMNKFTWGFELKFVWFVSASLCWGERGEELLKIKMPVHWIKMTREKQILLFSIERNGETSWTCMFLLLFAFVPAPTIITILFDARDSIRMNVSAYTLFLWVFFVLFGWIRDCSAVHHFSHFLEAI